MKRIYISHPYAKDPEESKRKVDSICKEILENGEGLPISPLHMFSFADDTYRQPILSACMELVGIVDEMWMYGDSEGCNLEKQVANQLGIPVVWKG
ncbi:hypothetical protein JR334_01960 [Clostridia bacterium]|nr:hypothetical protein JR334_01960 [Clostridia bacterium]